MQADQIPSLFSIIIRQPAILKSSALVAILFVLSNLASAQPTSDARDQRNLTTQQNLLTQYCTTCHNENLLDIGFVPVAFEGLQLDDVAADTELWEKVVKKMRLGTMPPQDVPQPDPIAYQEFITWLESELDDAATETLNVGRPAIRRLNAAEYVNAIEELLVFEVDAFSLLFPADDVDREGFATNGDALSFSPALFERYLTAANRISRLAVGDTNIGPGFATSTHITPRFLYQDDRMNEALPLGSRGGIAAQHYFPLDGDYEVKIRLRRMVYDYVIGMGKPQQLEVRLDGHLIERFTIGDADQYGYPSAYSFFGTIRGDNEWEEFMSVGADAALVVRFPARAGSGTLTVSFVGSRTEPTGILERRPAGFALSGIGFYYGNAAVERIEVTGPYNSSGPGETASRSRIFSCYPSSQADISAESCARQIVSTLARRAYRRPVTDEDIETLMAFYAAGQQEGGFETGVQKALERLLVAPEFLYRIERDPVVESADSNYRLTDLELATRLSLFLWSNIPDDELLTLAEAGKLSDSAVFEQQVRRMIEDERAMALMENFADQWLKLTRLDSIMPDADIYYQFDENLRKDMQRETSLFLRSQFKEDRSVLDILSADYTFLNERLAKHYGIEGVYGERFRRVQLDRSQRSGIMGHASLLTVTAYPTRTSPVLRGKWLLENILGMPPPPPPPDVPALKDNRADGEILSMRQRMEEHRRNPACAVCHKLMDPPGLAMENFDAIGRWRDLSAAGTAIDTEGTLADGTAVTGPASLNEALLKFEVSIARTVTEKLLGYATGRTTEHYDQPTIRRITDAAKTNAYSWSSLILGVVQSAPFQMRRIN